MRTKILFKSVLMMVAMAAVCVTLSSCGGDDDENLPGGGTDVGVEWFEPCFLWGASKDDVKDWMSSKPYSLDIDDATGNLLYYIGNNRASTVSYMFNGNASGMCYVCVTYGNVSKILEWALSQVENRYGVKMNKEVDETVGSVYTGTASIGGRTIGIIVTYENTSRYISVIFGIPEY